MARKKKQTQVQEISAAMRAAAHNRKIEQLRSGVKIRAITIPSGKRYRRARMKHDLRRETPD